MTIDLPSGWSVRKIGAVAEVNPRRPSYLHGLADDHRVSFVPMPAVDEASGAIASAGTRPFGEVKRGFTYFAEGDVIFAKITPCMQNGKAAIDLPPAAGPLIVRVRAIYPLRRAERREP